jgi:hypothetical protein
LVAEELTGVTGEESARVASEFGVDTGATVAAGLLVAAAAVVWVAFVGFLTFASFCELIASKLRTGIRVKGD